MKIAIIHPFMDNIGGAEKVVLTMAQDLKADIITTNYNSNKIKKQGFKDIKIKSIGKISANAPFRQQKALFLFMFKKLPKYDLYIIAGDWAMSALIRNKPNIWYVHSPIREIWDLKDYVRETKVLPYQRFIFDSWVLFNRIINKICVKHTKMIISNSKNTQRRVMTYLSRDSLLIYPPIETEKIKYNKTENYWFSQNRLADHKRVELQLEAFRQLPKEKLIILGSYEKSNVWDEYVSKIMKMKPKNVEIKSFVTEKEKEKLYGNCKGFIATAKDEDFGMNVVEAMSAGKPVIAVNEGGYKESIINGKTGYLVESNVESIIKGIKKINNPKKYRKDCEEQSKKFSRERFTQEIKQVISAIVPKKGKYDDFAKIYDSRINSKIMSEEDSFLKQINPKNKKILDLGCGTGRLNYKLSKKAKKMIGIDNSKEMLKIAKEKKIQNSKFIYSNIEKLPFKNNSFDIVVSSLAIEHLKSINETIKETKRVLKPHGEFIFSFSNFSDKKKTISIEKDNKNINIKIYPRTKNQYLKILKKYGFKIEKIIPVKINPQLKNSHKKIYDFWKGKTMSYILKCKL